jgi:hypothetical protein
LIICKFYYSKQDWNILGAIENTLSGALSLKHLNKLICNVNSELTPEYSRISGMIKRILEWLSYFELLKTIKDLFFENTEKNLDTIIEFFQ